MKKNAAAQIWINGFIQTMNPDFRIVNALAADAQGRLIYAGDEKGALALRGTDTVLHDLNGAYVVPGFIESHCHLPLYGSSLLELSIRDISKEQILEKVASASKSTPPGAWIIGSMGWNNEVWTDPSYPTRWELDAVAPRNPVMLPRMDGHLIWVNSQALAIAGVTSDTPDPPDGEYMRTQNGELQGCCSNGAAQRIKSFLPKPTAEHRRHALLAAQSKMLEYGITSVADMGTNMELLNDLDALYQSGEYKLRFYGGLRGFLGKEGGPIEKSYLIQCPKIGLYNDHFTVRCCKLLGDGSVGAQSAHLNEPFSDRPGHMGTGMFTDEELCGCLREAAQLGMQMAIHSIGDATIDQVLRCYKKVLSEHPNPDHRWRIEHFQTVTSNSPERAAKLGCVASMQPMHAPNSASMALRRLGPQRIHGAYAAGLVLKATGKIAFGSDAPVATPSPISGMHAAITRTNDQLLPEGGFCMENAVTSLQALQGYTTWGAYAMFAETNRGSLEPGKWADFVVLDQDVLDVGSSRPHELLQIKVLQTVIGGECVYRRG